MADDGSGKKEAIEGEVLAKEDKIAQSAAELAELKQQTAVIEAVGAQLKAIVETPGISGYLSGYGQAVAINAQLAVEAQKYQHALAMEQEKNGAASKRRLEFIGAVLFPLFGAMAVSSVFGLAWMVHAGIVTKDNAVTMGVVLAGVLTWINSQRKKPDEKK